MELLVEDDIGINKGQAWLHSSTLEREECIRLSQDLKIHTGWAAGDKDEFIFEESWRSKQKDQIII